MCIFEVESNGQFKFTDDTAMTRSVANSLIAVKGIDARDMAKRQVFCQSFKSFPSCYWSSLDLFWELFKMM